MELLKIIVDGLDLFCKEGRVVQGGFIVNLNLMRTTMRQVLTDRVEKVNSRDMLKAAARKRREQGVAAGFDANVLLDSAVLLTPETRKLRQHHLQ